MIMDIANFTPAEATLGGALIGLAAALFMLMNGRIAGVSGIMGGILRPGEGNMLWRVAFIFGLLVSPALYSQFASLPAIQIDSSNALLIVAGLLVGIGSRYGSGCTSGHGICGISRLSFRSILATLLFVLAGMATVFFMKNLVGGA
ncbi:MAG: YeeE/YedE thiosulfate transporter family protein [Rugosibacter sp.]|nr:YeeE/YedE thiosulfate transporter family protein [Rugosibacter sp.]